MSKKKLPEYAYQVLMSNRSKYSSHMNLLSKQIFNQTIMDKKYGYRQKRVTRLFAKRPSDLDPMIINYYPKHSALTGLFDLLREYGLYRCEHTDFNEEMARLKKLRGKQWKFHADREKIKVPYVPSKLK